MTGQSDQRSRRRASPRGLFDPVELQLLRQPRGLRVARDLSLVWGQIALGVGLYLAWPGPLTFAAAFLLIAGGQHGLALVAHEASHYSLIPSSRRWNDWIGRILFADPAMLPLDLFRHRHFIHHRSYSTDDDTKTVYRRSIEGEGFWVEALRSLSGFEFVSRVFGASAHRGTDRGRSGRSPLWALRTLLPVQAALYLLFALVDGHLYLALWVLPLVTAAEWFAKLRTLAEHRPLDADANRAPGSGFYRDTAGPFVRSVVASPWERLFLSKLNFGYHAEHHLWPQVSYQYLPFVRRRLEEAGAFEGPRLARGESYLSTIRKLRGLPASDLRAPAGDIPSF